MRRCTPLIRHFSKARGASRPIPRWNVSWAGMPDSKGKYWRSHASFAWPKSTISSHSSYPLKLALTHKNRISSNGYCRRRAIRGSGRTAKSVKKDVKLKALMPAKKTKLSGPF